jgi:hypothetical protein|tara:strand:- start:391 stop:609 length:219 start_codon:yes stop_codon:yes gene_type:complete
MFKYNLNQEVKVQVFNLITKGVIIKRTMYETNLGCSFKYLVEFGKGYDDVVESWEQDLDDVQCKELGEKINA